MATTLADIYYLKALENYPYELSEVYENLNYSLSYDENHAAANCLMGRLQMHYLKDLQAAEEYLEAALAVDPDFACAYENLIELYLYQKRVMKAQRVLEYAQKIPGVSRAFVLGQMSRILEIKGSFSIAKHYLKVALTEAREQEEQELWQSELERLKRKIKLEKDLQK